MKKTFYKELKTKFLLNNFIWKAKKLSMGEKCKEFETRFARYQGRKYAILFNSGSSANLVLIHSLVNLGLLKEGKNVGFSAVTWATNVMPITQLNMNPVPIDVSLENLNITSENLLESLNKKKISALFVTNLLGFCGDLDKIKEICNKKGIILIEDNCESLGSTIKNQKLGNFGLASTFSFYVGHHLSTIEGGMVCTDDEDLYNMLIMVRAHGWGRNLNPTKRAELKNKHQIDDFYEKYCFYISGYNLRPTEITGFLGCEQLKYLPETIRKRMSTFIRYDLSARKNPDFLRLNLRHMDFISNFAYPVICKNKETFEHYKNKFDKKVEIRPIVAGCIVNQPFFKDKKHAMKNAEIIHNFGFYIPNNPDLSKKEINTIRGLLENRN